MGVVEQEKALWRDKMERRLRLLSLDARRLQSEQLCRKLGQIPALQHIRCIAAYLPLASEINVLPLLVRLVERGVVVGVPAAVEGGNYQWTRWKADDPCEKGRDGVQQPVMQQSVATSDIELVLVPGRAFALDGTRLGRGGGWYDRLLTDVAACCVGVAFDEQLVETLPVEAHDIPMNILVTNKRIITIEKK